MSDGNLDTYISFKLFDIFRTRLLPLVNEYRKDKTETDVYKHLFLAPSSYSKKRAFQVKGVSSPFVCLWATSPLTWNKAFYARSVLPVDFEYNAPKKDSNDTGVRIDRGFLYDYEKKFELSASSYFANFRASVQQDLLDLDRIRYLDINVDELLPGYSCKVELLLENLVTQETVDQAANNRSFDLGAKYNLKVTLPVLSKPELYIERINLYLNSQLVWLKQVVDVSP